LKMAWVASPAWAAPSQCSFTPRKPERGSDPLPQPFDSLALSLRASRWLLLPLVVAPCLALAREIMNRL